MHKVFIYHNKYSKKITKEEFKERMKKLKATKKAAAELNDQDKIFYELLITIGLTKDQKKDFRGLRSELDTITDQYHR